MILLMATGLTFDSIAALYGRTNHLITQARYTELVTVVILSAFVPTLIAQQFFRPIATDTEKEEALGAEDVSLRHRRSLAGDHGDAQPAQPVGRIGNPDRTGEYPPAGEGRLSRGAVRGHGGSGRARWCARR
jgi:hypothetical protein